MVDKLTPNRAEQDVRAEIRRLRQEAGIKR